MVHLGANRVPLGPKKWVKTVKNYHAPKFEFSTTPRSSLFPKKWKLWLWRQNTVGTTRVHLWASGVPLGKKKPGQNHQKLPCPKMRIFDYPAVNGFSQKMEVTVIAPNHGGDTIESISGTMGSHWVQKLGQNRKELPCPRIRNFDYPAVIDFSQKMEVTVMALNHGGEPLGSILGPVGSHWVNKMGQNRKKLPCPRIRIFHYPTVIGFSKKWKLRLWRQITVGTP